MSAGISKKDTSNVSLTLNRLLTDYHISASELARQTGVSQPVVHRIINGETDNPKMETLRQIANYFSISINQLIGETEININSDGKITGIPQALNIPVLALEQAHFWPEQKHKATPIKTVLIEPTSANKHFFAVTLEDTAMSPSFPAGTIIIIDPELLPKDSDYVVIHRQGQNKAMFKQFLTDGENKYFKSLNPDFPMMQMTKDHKILGVMIQARIEYPR